MEGLANFFNTLLGLDADKLNLGQMLVRGLVVYLITLVLIRLGDKRFIGKNTAFDTVLAIILGSIVSRAITGNSPFFPTLGTAAGVVILHGLLATFAFHTSWFGPLIKGQARVLVKDGEIQWDEMETSHISEKDLMTAVRSQAGTTTLDDVREARLERDGSISVIKRS